MIDEYGIDLNSDNFPPSPITNQYKLPSIRASHLPSISMIDTKSSEQIIDQ